MPESSLFEQINTVILTVLACVGTGTALWGINTWKRQLYWETDHKLARRILTGLYRHRDAIRHLRNPAVFHQEMEVPTEPFDKEMDDDQIRYYGQCRAYEKRWKQVNDVNADLYPDLLEAEAVWHGKLSGLVEPIKRLEADLIVATHQLLDTMNPSHSDEHKYHLTEQNIKSRRLIMATLNDKDEFDQSYQSALNEIEEFLKRKIGRR